MQNDNNRQENQQERFIKNGYKLFWRHGKDSSRCIKRIIAVDAELHADLAILLSGSGSKQPDLWGINFYPEMEDEDFIEHDRLSI